jgi:Flp pilus assembly protein TadG
MVSARRLTGCRAGSTAIEFAIISMVMMIVTLGIIEMGRGLNLRNQLSHAADYGARKILNEKAIADTIVESAIRSAFIAASSDLLQVTLGVETVDAMSFRTISITYPFVPIIPQISSGTITLSVSRRIPVI